MVVCRPLKWNHYRSRSLVLPRSTARWYATDIRKQRLPWLKFWARQIGKDCQRTIADGRYQHNGVEEEYIREDPCSTFRPYSAFHEFGIGTSVPAQTQYVRSHKAFNSSDTEREEGPLRVRRELVEFWRRQIFNATCMGSTFEHQKPRRLDLDLFSSKHSILKYSQVPRLHVLADLQPYICTSRDLKKSRCSFRAEQHGPIINLSSIGSTDLGTVQSDLTKAQALLSGTSTFSPSIHIILLGPASNSKSHGI